MSFLEIVLMLIKGAALALELGRLIKTYWLTTSENHRQKLRKPKQKSERPAKAA